MLFVVGVVFKVVSWHKVGCCVSFVRFVRHSSPEHAARQLTTSSGRMDWMDSSTARTCVRTGTYAYVGVNLFCRRLSHSLSIFTSHCILCTLRRRHKQPTKHEEILFTWILLKSTLSRFGCLPISQPESTLHWIHDAMPNSEWIAAVHRSWH